MLFTQINVLNKKIAKISQSTVPVDAANAIEESGEAQLKSSSQSQDKEGQEYWKNQIFSILSTFLLIFGVPLFIFSSYMFYKEGFIIHAAFQMLECIVLSTVITRKTIDIQFRKLFLVLNLYFISILLLVSIGVMGAGMVCVIFSLMLVGCLLDKRQAYIAVSINLLSFAFMTILLMNGYLDNTNMAAYKPVWMINAITTQVFGITSIVLMNTIFNGLESQTKEAKLSKASLIASEIKHIAMIANISDAIVILNEQGYIKYLSPNMKREYGWAMEKILEVPIWERVYFEDRETVIKEFSSILCNCESEKKLEVRYLGQKGAIRYIELTAVNLIKDPNINGILVNFHDITERKLREKEILYLSYHDSLTGLYNRAFFEQEKYKLDKENQLPISIIIGDINGLKMLNDSLGHAEGDKLVVTMANILRSCCRKEDILARVGGDEFNIILPRTSSTAAYEIIKKISSTCEEYNKKLISELYYTSISLGAATKTEMSQSLDSIMKSAEDFMYRQKLLEGRSLHSAVMTSMKTALFEKSQETEAHAERLVKLSKAVGNKIGLTNQQFVELELFATLHDIGKIGIDDQILNKPGTLTDDEWIEMRKHCEVGYRIAMSSLELMPIAKYIFTHHERWDGTGYPQGLRGENIPLLSRILSVVDAYDAMIEDRPYRKALTKEAALAEIKSNSGKQFDPTIAEVFIEIIENNKS